MTTTTTTRLYPVQNLPSHLIISKFEPNGAKIFYTWTLNFGDEESLRLCCFSDPAKYVCFVWGWNFFIIRIVLSKIRSTQRAISCPITLVLPPSRQYWLIFSTEVTFSIQTFYISTRVSWICWNPARSNVLILTSSKLTTQLQ